MGAPVEVAAKVEAPAFGITEHGESGTRELGHQHASHVLVHQVAFGGGLSCFRARRQRRFYPTLPRAMAPEDC